MTNPIAAENVLGQLPYWVIAAGLVLCAILSWDVIRTSRVRSRRSAHLPSRRGTPGLQALRQELELVRFTLSEEPLGRLGPAAETDVSARSPGALAAALERTGLNPAEIGRKLGITAADVRFMLKIQELVAADRLIREAGQP